MIGQLSHLNSVGETYSFHADLLSLVAAVQGSVFDVILSSSLTCFQQALQSLCPHPPGRENEGITDFPSGSSLSQHPVLIPLLPALSPCTQGSIPQPLPWGPHDDSSHLLRLTALILLFIVSH